MILSILFYLFIYWLICFYLLLGFIELYFYQSENKIQASLEWAVEQYNLKNGTNIHPYIYNDTPTWRFYLTYFMIGGILPPLIILQTIKILKDKPKK